MYKSPEEGCTREQRTRLGEQTKEHRLVRLRSCKRDAGMEKNKRQLDDRQRFLRKRVTGRGSSSRWASWSSEEEGSGEGVTRVPVLSMAKRCQEPGLGGNGMEQCGENTKERKLKRLRRSGPRGEAGHLRRSVPRSLSVWAVSSSLCVSLGRIKWPSMSLPPWESCASCLWRVPWNNSYYFSQWCCKTILFSA